MSQHLAKGYSKRLLCCRPHFIVFPPCIWVKSPSILLLQISALPFRSLELRWGGRVTKRKREKREGVRERGGGERDRETLNMWLLLILPPPSESSSVMYGRGTSLNIRGVAARQIRVVAFLMGLFLLKHACHCCAPLLSLSQHPLPLPKHFN